MAWIADKPEDYIGQKVGSGQCVALVQKACGVPHTSQWCRGRKVRGGAVAAGTAIATFDPDTRRYGNHTDGRSHAAIFVAETGAGLLAIDQWSGQPVHQRTIYFRGGQGKPVNNGDRYHVIEEAET